MKLCQCDGGRCLACGAQCVNRRQACGPLPPGLGDMVAAGLSAVGITKDRAQAVAQSVGIEDCGCHERQELLNRLGYKLGIGTPPAACDPPAAQ